jgi:hypothetical protein
MDSYKSINRVMFMVEASPVEYKSSRVLDASASIRLWAADKPRGVPEHS